MHVLRLQQQHSPITATLYEPDEAPTWKLPTLQQLYFQVTVELQVSEEQLESDTVEKILHSVAISILIPAARWPEARDLAPWIKVSYSGI